MEIWYGVTKRIIPVGKDNRPQTGGGQPCVMGRLQNGRPKGSDGVVMKRPETTGFWYQRRTEKEKGAPFQSITHTCNATHTNIRDVRDTSPSNGASNGTSTYQLLLMPSFPQATLDRANTPPLLIEPKELWKSRKKKKKNKGVHWRDRACCDRGSNTFPDVKFTILFLALISHSLDRTGGTAECLPAC